MSVKQERSDETVSCCEQTVSSPDDTWSVLESTTDIETLNYGILNQPATVYILDPVHGHELNIQLLRNFIVYPARYDKSGSDIVFVMEDALEDKSFKLSFCYILDAVLGHFYNLSEHVLDKNFKKDLILIVFLRGTQPELIPCHIDNLLAFTKAYNEHNLRVTVVAPASILKCKKMIQAEKMVKSSNTFLVSELISYEALSDKLNHDLIPKEFGGSYDLSDMDVWTNKRLQFELFWENCRTCYTRLQFLPSSIKEIAVKVLTENSNSSFDTIQSIYLQETQKLTFISSEQDIQSHGRHILKLLENDNINRCDIRMMVNAVHILLRIMSELEDSYSELQGVFTKKFQASWRWVEFKKDMETLSETVTEVKGSIDKMRSRNVDNVKYNEWYSTMQSVKTSFHELTKRQDLLPIKKQRKAEMKLQSLEEAISENFAELGKNSEKMVSTELVLNIQYDILSWIKEFQELLQLPAGSEPDIFRKLLSKRDNIWIKLKYAPTDVIEEYLNTCQRVGTDFLLASVLAVENSLTRLIENISETSHYINKIIDMKLESIKIKLQSLLDRTKLISTVSAPSIVECSSSLEKMLSLVNVLLEAPVIEFPEIPDISVFKLIKKESPINQREILQELTQTMWNLVEEENVLSNRSRFLSINRSPPECSSRRSSRCSFRNKIVDPGQGVTWQHSRWDLDILLCDIEDVVKQHERISFEKEVDKVTEGTRKKKNKCGDKMLHILTEFENTERKYVKSLQYLSNELLEKSLGDEEFQVCSADRERLEKASLIVKKILDLNTSLLDRLSLTNKLPMKVAQIFSSYQQEFLVYVEFIKIQPTLESILEMEYFKEIQKINSDRLPAESFLNNPMQRLCKYKLLFEDIVQNTTSIFEVPATNHAALTSKKLLRHCNDVLHLQDEQIVEESPLLLHSKITLSENRQLLGERRAYLFQTALYLTKPLTKEPVYYETKSMKLLEVNKQKLEIIIKSEQIFTVSKGTLSRKGSLKRFRDLALTLMFQDYSELMEWLFKLNNILGQY